MNKTLPAIILALTVGLAGASAFAQQAADTGSSGNASVNAAAAQPWTYKTKNLNRQEVDKLLGNPRKLLVIDVRRPDELSKYGSFPVYLNVQIDDLPDVLDYIPKDRLILTVSNRAHRAGAAGDLLSSRGYKVAGAIGSVDYAEAGGTIVKVAPKVAAAAAAASK